MSKRVSLWAMAGGLALAAMQPADAQRVVFGGAIVRDHNGSLIHGLMSPGGSYMPAWVPGLQIVPNYNYAFHYDAQRPIILIAQAPQQPAVGQVQTATISLVSGTAPKDLRVKPGTVVAWTNTADKERTVFVQISKPQGTEDQTSVKSWQVAPKGSFSLVFHQPGVYEYYVQDDPTHRARVFVEG